MSWTGTEKEKKKRSSTSAIPGDKYGIEAINLCGGKWNGDGNEIVKKLSLFITFCEWDKFGRHFSFYFISPSSTSFFLFFNFLLSASRSLGYIIQHTDASGCTSPRRKSPVQRINNSQRETEKDGDGLETDAGKDNGFGRDEKDINEEWTIRSIQMYALFEYDAQRRPRQHKEDRKRIWKRKHQQEIKNSMREKKY